MTTEQKLQMCSRCHSTILLKYFSTNRQGKPYKTCLRCRQVFKCEIGECEDKFCTKSELTNHIKADHDNIIEQIPTEQKLQKCSRCRSTILLKYFSINRQGKPYKTCMRCRQFYKCKIGECKNKFCTKSELQRHIKADHDKIM